MQLSALILDKHMTECHMCEFYVRCGDGWGEAGNSYARPHCIIKIRLINAIQFKLVN